MRLKSVFFSVGLICVLGIICKLFWMNQRYYSQRFSNLAFSRPVAAAPSACPEAAQLGVTCSCLRSKLCACLWSFVTQLLLARIVFKFLCVYANSVLNTDMAQRINCITFLLLQTLILTLHELINININCLTLLIMLTY